MQIAENLRQTIFWEIFALTANEQVITVPDRSSGHVNILGAPVYIVANNYVRYNWKGASAEWK